MAENVTGEQGRMTRAHVYEIDALVAEATLYAPVESLRRVKELQSLIASIVSEDTVCVKRSEIENLADDLQHHGYAEDSEMVLRVLGWLATPATQDKP